MFHPEAAQFAAIDVVEAGFGRDLLHGFGQVVVEMPAADDDALAADVVIVGAAGMPESTVVEKNQVDSLVVLAACNLLPSSKQSRLLLSQMTDTKNRTPTLYLMCHHLQVYDFVSNIVNEGT
jgi:hypothetical protein